MLVYRDTKAAKRRVPPPGLDGAADLLEVADRNGRFRWWGISNAHLVGERDDWADLDDGWQVAVASKVDPQMFRRTMRWCRTVDVDDAHGRTWTAPVVLNASGDRCILVSYGKDFLPVLSNAQERALAVASAARDALVAAQGIDGAGLDFPVAARWVAELLALTHHIGMEAIGALGLIDDALILAVLGAATGLSLKTAEA